MTPSRAHLRVVSLGEFDGPGAKLENFGALGARVWRLQPASSQGASRKSRLSWVRDIDSRRQTLQESFGSLNLP